MMLLLLSIVTNIDLSSLWLIYTVYRQISDLNRLTHGSLSIEEIQRIKLRSIQTILLNLLLTISSGLY